jgi:hypothetical protein
MWNIPEKEFSTVLYQLRQKHKAEIANLIKEVGEEITLFKIGDTISENNSDRCIYIKTVEIIGEDSYPRIRYTGPELNSRMVPYKNGREMEIYQHNVNLRSKKTIVK